MRVTSKLMISLAAATLAVLPAWAGGPNNPNGDGTYLKWDANVPVNYTIDLGALGSLSNQDAADIVREAAKRWNNVATSRLTLKDNGYLDVDVTADNYETFFGLGAGQEPKLRTENPIIFDSDGRLTNLVLGEGSNNTTLGFAGIRYYNPSANTVLSGWAVLNGKRASLPNNPWRSTDRFPRTLIHELGHLLGLDHSQGIQENFQQGWTKPCGETDSYCAEIVPLMYPYLDIRGTTYPQDDEVAWFSWMYPTANFPTTTGTIKGRALRRSGGGLQGANVVAVRAIDQGNGTYTMARDGAVSVVSDFLMLGTGAFELPGLAPGKYYVYIEPLDSAFTGGSGVGPFESRPTSFIRDYYSIPETATEDTTAKNLIEVGAGQTVTGIDIIANEVVNNLAALGDDDEMLYEFPEGFQFPFLGNVYNSVVVNSDGNLTFGQGDGKVGTARTESRFLSGPPRIAPLFTDLDPSVSSLARVKAEVGGDYVKFIWNNVPEFVDQGTASPNLFSVTLYASGNILFSYENLAITPDPDQEYAQGLQAVVGITPGGLSSGTARDLSVGEFPLEGSSIYEVFPGTTLDLNGKQILFSASSHTLLFPYLRESSSQFTGFAFSNYGEDVGSLTMEARGTDGAMAGYPTNPAAESVDPGKQIAKLGREVFGYTVTEQRDGWMRVLSSQPEIGSFYLYGNGVTNLDGSVAITEPSDKLYFTRLYHGTGVYPSLSGWLDAITELTVVNPNGNAVAVTMKLYGPTGLQIGQDVNRNLDPQGFLRETLGELFGLTSETIRDGYVGVSAAGSGLIGTSVIRLNDTVLGLNASPPSTASKLYSAQLGHGDSIFTSLKVVNPTNQAITVSIRGYIVDSGAAIDERFVAPFLLSPNQSFQRNVDQLFGLLGLPSEPFVGSIEVSSEPAGVVGDVVFGDPQNGGYAAALPLQSVPFKRAVFSQVSNGIVPAGGNSLLNAFTGLALFNPNASKATVNVEVFDREGVSVGTTEIDLGGKQRISKLLVQLIPQTAGQVRGYIVVTSDQPVVGQELFGNYALKYMAAVPPKIIE